MQDFNLLEIFSEKAKRIDVTIDFEIDHTEIKANYLQPNPKSVTDFL